MDTKLNINALNISPYLWWKFIDKALHFANHYSKELFNYNFEEWLNSEFTSDGKVFDIETWDGYKSNIKENKFRDFLKVGKKNSIGVLISVNNEEELNDMASIAKDEPLVYTYSITSLHHFCFNYFNLWLIFNTEENWHKWQSYFKFITYNVDASKADVYKHFWFWVLLEIDKQEEFEEVSQYKKFVRILHELEKETDYLEKKWIEKRDAINNSA